MDEIAELERELARTFDQLETFATDGWEYFTETVEQEVASIKDEIASPKLPLERIPEKRGALRAFEFSLARPKTLAIRREQLIEQLRELHDRKE